MYIIVFFMMISVVTPSIDVGRANQRGANSPHIQTDRSGQLYAKSFPFDRYGSRGATKIYQLGRKDRATGLIKSDTLLHTYHCHWYAQKLYLAGNAGYKEIYVIQMGPPIKRYRALLTFLHALSLSVASSSRPNKWGHVAGRANCSLDENRINLLRV